VTNLGRFLSDVGDIVSTFCRGNSSENLAEGTARVGGNLRGDYSLVTAEFVHDDDIASPNPLSTSSNEMPLSHEIFQQHGQDTALGCQRDHTRP